MPLMRPLCVGFVRPRGTKNGWLPCGRRAVSGSSFCTEHRDAFDGAFLGLFRRYGLFRDDPYTETKTIGAAHENGERQFVPGFTPSADTSASGGTSPPTNAAAGQRAHRKAKANTKARANWRRTAAKRSR